jgi:hypothetical protein
VNDDQLRRLLQDAAVPTWDDDVRASSALYAGHRAVTRRHRVVGAMGTAVLAAGVVVALLPARETPATDVVLGCEAGTGTTGSGVVTGGVDGVTVAVSNPTHDVLSVVAGGRTVLALPGRSSVTLPLAAGTSTVRCGSGAPVRLTVQHLSAQRACSSVGTALLARVESGALDELTRAQVGALPSGAVVDTSAPGSPVRRVVVRHAGHVLAEAVWREMPTGSSWQLESVSRCS